MRITIYKGQYGWYAPCYNYKDHTKKKNLSMRFVNCEEPVVYGEDNKRIINIIEGKHNVNDQEQITSITIFKYEMADELNSAPGIDAYGKNEQGFDKNVRIDEEELPFY